MSTLKQTLLTLPTYSNKPRHTPLAPQALTSDNRQHLSGLLMESWVNQVLAGPAEQHASGLPNQQLLQPAQAAFKGLLKHGLTKAELAHAGLGAEAVDRLYRTLYVYSVGLFDTLQVRGAPRHVSASGRRVLVP